MKIAIIGSGISGLTAAYVLNRRHDVTLFETAGYIGGHTNTVLVNEGDRTLPIDTGFIVFNELNYPHLTQLFNHLGVPSRESQMSFSVHCERSGLEYNGSTLTTLFSQRTNLAKPKFWRLLSDILAFNKRALRALTDGLSDALSIGEFAAQGAYGKLLYSHYLAPMGAAIWSCPTHRFHDFPARFVIEFMANHRLLQVNDRPLWRTVEGGSYRYVAPLTNRFADKIHLQTAAHKVTRTTTGASVTFSDGRAQTYDHVIVATHADQALSLLAAADSVEQELLGAFPYQFNEAVLHTDSQMLPDSKRAWASWNYRLSNAAPDRVTMTYNMNILQGLTAEKTYCVTLNQTDRIDPQQVIKRIGYHHPRFGPGLHAAQTRHYELIDRAGVSFCGAYWGHGFHEDGVTSALRVCEAFGLSLFE